MFQASLDKIHQWFCDNTNFKRLENPAFDDRHQTEGYFIEEADGQTDFISNDNYNLFVTASRRFNIYLQYKEDKLDKLITSLLYTHLCGGLQVIGSNDDSKAIFEDRNKPNLYSDNGFSFAYITVELKVSIRAKECEVC